MNASMAIEIALALWRKGYEITDEQIIAGLEQASFPARIEVLRRHPLLLLDGCHNPDGTVTLRYPGGSVTLRQDAGRWLTASNTLD